MTPAETLARQIATVEGESCGFYGDGLASFTADNTLLNCVGGANLMWQPHQGLSPMMAEPNFGDLVKVQRMLAPPVTRTVTKSTTKEAKVAAPARRLVRVLVVDPDENVPTDKCLLHAGSEQFTDATDEELFFDIDIKGILAAHNEYRITLTEKGKTEKAKKLEPARIRDLKMVVVTLATF